MRKGEVEMLSYAEKDLKKYQDTLKVIQNTKGFRHDYYYTPELQKALIQSGLFDNKEITEKTTEIKPSFIMAIIKYVVEKCNNLTKDKPTSGFAQGRSIPATSSAKNTTAKLAIKQHDTTHLAKVSSENQNKL